MVWLGSIAFDGYPEGLPAFILNADSETYWVNDVGAMLQGRDDATLPAQGWPWPWPDSRTTDYAYTFEGGVVLACAFGHSWWRAAEGEPEFVEGSPQVEFPDMSAVQRIAWDKRSGIIMLRADEDG